MSRISLATDVRTRAGNPDKDARMKNAYIELRGEQSAARKRPSAQGGVPVGLGTPQGGYGLVLFWGDTPYPITANTGTTWNGGTGYVIGDHVSVGFTDYWATAPNTGSMPPSVNWSRNFVAPVPPSSGWTLGTMAIGPYPGNNTIACNGTVFVYLQDNAGTGFAVPFTSTNGTVWTQQADTSISYGVSNFYGINWNGSQFLTVGGSGTGTCQTLTSANGITWTLHTDAATPDLRDVAWNGSTYCAVSGGNAYTSVNGATWTAHALPAGTDFRAITWNGFVFCTVCRATNIVCTSANGIIWSQTTLPYTTTWLYVTSMGSLICATGGNGTRVAVSTDNGATWSGTIPTTPVQQIASSASLIVAVNPGATTATYSTSSDGLTWVNHILPATKIWNCIAYGTGKGFVAMDTTTVCAFSITGT